MISLLRKGTLTLCALLTCVSCAPAPRANQEIPSSISSHEVTSIRLFEEGVRKFNQSRLLESEKAFRQAFYLNPQASNIAFNLAVTLERAGLYEEARTILEKITKERGETVSLQLARARIYQGERQHVRAIESFEKAYLLAIEKDETTQSVNVARLLSNFLFRLGDEQEAVCQAGRVIDLKAEPSDVLAYAKILIATGRFESAKTILSSYMNDKGLLRDSLFLHQRALAEIGLGNKDEALLMVSTALATTSLDPTIKVELEFIAYYLGVGSFEEDDEEREEYLELFKNIPASHRLWWPEALVAAHEQFLEEHGEE